MMGKRKMKSAAFYFVAAVFLACYLAETVECYRRHKPFRLDVRKEADSTQPVDVHEGEILFGKSLEGPESQLMDGTNQRSSNTSVEDETGYQADAPVLPYGHEHMDAWNQMTKSLQCGADQMYFKVAGQGHQHFAVNQLNGPSLPLPLVPPSCGYNMRRFPSYLLLSIPYSGCNVLQQGGQYMLPLTWRGIPVVLSCRGPPPAGDGQNWLPWPYKPIPHLPPFPFPPYPWYPPAGDTTTAAPTTTPQMHPAYPFPWYHAHPHYHRHPYYNYLYYHSHPHMHYPYWLHAQDPTPDSPPMTTMIPYSPPHYPTPVPDQGKVFPWPVKS